MGERARLSRRWRRAPGGARGEKAAVDVQRKVVHVRAVVAARRAVVDERAAAIANVVRPVKTPRRLARSTD